MFNGYEILLAAIYKQTKSEEMRQHRWDRVSVSSATAVYLMLLWWKHNLRATSSMISFLLTNSISDISVAQLYTRYRTETITTNQMLCKSVFAKRKGILSQVWIRRWMGWKITESFNNFLPLSKNVYHYG